MCVYVVIPNSGVTRWPQGTPNRLSSPPVKSGVYRRPLGAPMRLAAHRPDEARGALALHGAGGRRGHGGRRLRSLKLRLDLALDVAEVALEPLLGVLDPRQGLLVLLARRRQVRLPGHELCLSPLQLG